MLLQWCIIYSVASATSATIDERLEHELQTNRRNYEEERRCGDCVTGQKRAYFLLHFTSNKYWDGCSLFLCLTGKTGSGRPGPYNVQLTVVDNNCYESSVCVCARMRGSVCLYWNYVIISVIGPIIIGPIIIMRPYSSANYTTRTNIGPSLNLFF